MARYTIRRAALPVVGLVCVLLLWAGAQARAIGTRHDWAQGIPVRARVGQTITFSVWYQQDSRDRMDILDYQLHVWNPAVHDSGQLKGVTLSVLNPVTGRWQAQTETVDTTYFDLGGRTVPLDPNRTGHTWMRVTFGPAAHLGTWRFAPAAGTYTLRDSDGHQDENYVRADTRQYTLQLTR